MVVFVCDTGIVIGLVKILVPLMLLKSLQERPQCPLPISCPGECNSRFKLGHVGVFIQSHRDPHFMRTDLADEPVDKVALQGIIRVAGYEGSDEIHKESKDSPACLFICVRIACLHPSVNHQIAGLFVDDPVLKPYGPGFLHILLRLVPLLLLIGIFVVRLVIDAFDEDRSVRNEPCQLFGCLERPVRLDRIQEFSSELHCPRLRPLNHTDTDRHARVDNNPGKPARGDVDPRAAGGKEKEEDEGRGNDQ